MKSLLILGAVSLALVACGPAQPNYPQTAAVAVADPGYEVEDCDADDLIEGDEDCYGVDLKKKKKHKKKTAKHASATSASSPIYRAEAREPKAIKLPRKSTASSGYSKPSYSSSSRSSSPSRSKRR